eukprot:jgi/Mesvir1/3211/Mv16363-RA.1
MRSTFVPSTAVTELKSPRRSVVRKQAAVVQITRSQSSSGQPPPLEFIAEQLRKPNGAYAVDIATTMERANAPLAMEAYRRAMTSGQAPTSRLLEVGFANGSFVKAVFDSYPSLKYYYGVDYSAEMVELAAKNNRELIEQGKAKFFEADLDRAVLPRGDFDACVSCNTLYFWPRPLQNAITLRDALKPGGQLVLGIRPKHILQAMNFTKEVGFTAYTPEEVVDLLTSAGFATVTWDMIEEKPVPFMGKTVNLQGQYITATKAL